jgi:hypothetical protein
VRDRTKQFVLDTLKPVIFDPSSVKIEPPIFKELLEHFDFCVQAAKGRFQADKSGQIR